MKRLQFDLNRSFIHPFFSIFTPYLFLITYDRIINNLTSFNIPFYLVLSIIFSGIAESIFSNLYDKKYSDYLVRIRECIFIIVICSVIYYVLLDGVLIFVFYLVLLVFLQWFLSFNIHRNFRSREILFNDVKNKKGKYLSDILRNSQFVSQEAFFDLSSIKKIIIYFQLIIFFLVLIYYLSNIQLKLSTVIAITINSIFSFITISVINFYTDEQKMLFKGFLLDNKIKNDKLSFIFIFLSVTFIISLILSSYLKLFNYSDLVYLLSLISGLFPGPPRRETNPLFDKMRETQSNRMQQIESFNKLVNDKILFKIFIYITAALFITAIAFMLILIFIFLFKPFFKKLNLKNIKLKRKINLFFSFIKSIIDSTIKFFKALFSNIRATVSINKNIDGINKKLNIIHIKNMKKISKKKKKEINSIIKSFMHVIKWGEKKGVKYYGYLAPKEYINNLTAFLNKTNDVLIVNLNKIADIFEEVIFSDHIIGNEVIKNYKTLIKNTTKEN
ncbi:MAG: hypothetical protein JXB50_08270 [Spirochaetes bacterium]|nr:hypothetical protein [Spirochaetota bacterium]